MRLIFPNGEETTLSPGISEAVKEYRKIRNAEGADLKDDIEAIRDLLKKGFARLRAQGIHMDTPKDTE